MSVPRSNVVFMVFDNCHPANAVNTLRVPKRKQWVVCFLAFALGDVVGNVVVHFITPRQKYPA